MKKLTHHIRHYTPLIGILVAAFCGFWAFQFDRLFQMALLIAVGISYVAWGIIHHYIHKDLTLEIVLEYVAIAVLGIVLVWSVVIRS